MDDFKTTESELREQERIESEKKKQDEEKKKRKRIIRTIIVIIIIIILLLLRACGGCGTGKHNPGRNQNIEIETETENNWDGTVTDKATVEASTEMISIPGYYDMTITKDTRNVKLGNAEENTVYLKYTVTEGDQILYETKNIKPGNMVELDLYSLLSSGDHEITFTISSLDIETGEPCNGAAQTITVTVEK